MCLCYKLLQLFFALRAVKIKNQQPSPPPRKNLAQQPEESMGGLLAALRAAAEPTRLRIIALLSGGELTVTELVESLGQSQPRVSRHLKILAEARILTRYREGSLVFLRLADLTTFNGAHPAIDLANQLVKLLPITKTGERDLNPTGRSQIGTRQKNSRLLFQNCRTLGQPAFFARR
jgi:DNA-binding transcriptional ArsR family regulator